MAKPTPSLSADRPYLFEAEFLRQKAKARYGSKDVLWLRLAERELEAEIAVEHAGKDRDDQLLTQEIGRAILSAGAGAGEQFEEARRCVRLDQAFDRKNPEFFDAWAACYHRLQRAPTEPELRKQMHFKRARAECESRFQEKAGRIPNEQELSELLESDFQSRNRAVPAPTEIRAKCKELGLPLTNNNHLTEIRKVVATMGRNVSLPALQSAVAGKPTLKGFLLPHWRLDDFIRWLRTLLLTEDETFLANLSPSSREVAHGLVWFSAQWDYEFSVWLDGLTADGSVRQDGGTTVSDAFWGFFAKHHFPPSVPEFLMELPAGALASIAEVVPDQGKLTTVLQELRAEILATPKSPNNVYNTEVGDLSLLVGLAEELFDKATDEALGRLDIFLSPEGG